MIVLAFRWIYRRALAGIICAWIGHSVHYVTGKGDYCTRCWKEGRRKNGSFINHYRDDIPVFLASLLFVGSLILLWRT